MLQPPAQPSVDQKITLSAITEVPDVDQQPPPQPPTPQAVHEKIRRRKHSSIFKDIPRPNDPNYAPKVVIVLVCDGALRTSSTSSMSEVGNEGLSMEEVPLCPHARALEMIMMEFGVSYCRYIVDSREFSERNQEGDGDEAASATGGAGGGSDSENKAAEEKGNVPEWWHSVSKEVLFSRYGDSKTTASRPVSACLPALRIDGVWVCAPAKDGAASSLAAPLDVVDFLAKKLDISHSEQEEQELNFSSARHASGKVLSVVGWKFIGSLKGSYSAAVWYF